MKHYKIYSMGKMQFGMIGLGVMGRNFLLNVAENGFSCIGYDLDPEKREMLLAEGKGFAVGAAGSLTGFLENLESPRKVMILVPANVVDIVIKDLVGQLDKGDIVIDGGNSHFADTERREKLLNENGLEFIGVGVSGGEKGARQGCSVMPGGKAGVFEELRPVFEAVSAKVAGEPCVAHVGQGAAGHFVKMVHNGIEYGLMQLICEVYGLMGRGMNIAPGEMAGIFEEWNKGELSSFLIEITGKILRKVDEKTGKPLIDVILDTAGQKGTGKWASQAALDLGVPVPTIDSAVAMRQVSSLKAARVLFSRKAGAKAGAVSGIGAEGLRDALYAAFIICYAQGLALISVASKEKGYGVDLAEVSRIWRGGCIIRASLLEDIRKAFAAVPELENILFNDDLANLIAPKIAWLRKAVAESARAGFPSLCMMSSLAYFDALRSERLPANMLQAQRDLFGAHTYQRIDSEGIFHTDWD